MIAYDNTGKLYEVLVQKDEIYISKDSISSSIDYIEISDDSFNASVGDDGYYLVADVDRKGSHLCKFTVKSDSECITKQDLMPVFGIKKEDKCIFGIVTGLRHNFYVVLGVKDNKYYFKLRFEITAMGAYEDIRIKIINLEADADYNTMAAVYRNYKLEKGDCQTIKERVKTNEYLKYAVNAPEIRIRLVWKPAPPTVLEQTVENEPKMHVACTFERVIDIIDELKRQGVDKAQLCLVGWNKSGHDGRYPQLFPVEEKLGGEEKLKELIKHAQDNGYQIVCHTNSTDCYSIADSFSEDIVIKDKDGNLQTNNIPWSGGKMYHLCPKKALRFAYEDLPKIKELGFKGLHYIDVMTIESLRECYDKNHNLNKEQTLDCFKDIMKLSHNTLGGFASEGAADYASKYLDYALYVSWSGLENELFDCEVPFYQLVYHGIILTNPSTVTVNSSVKRTNSKLKQKEYGGRPSFYYYSKFMQGSELDDWLGSDDLICDTDEQLKYSVAKIKEVYDEYKTEAFLQEEFMISHKEIQPGVFVVEYANGSKITVDWNKEEYHVQL